MAPWVFGPPRWPSWSVPAGRRPYGRLPVAFAALAAVVTLSRAGVDRSSPGSLGWSPGVPGRGRARAHGRRGPAARARRPAWVGPLALSRRRCWARRTGSASSPGWSRRRRSPTRSGSRADRDLLLPDLRRLPAARRPLGAGAGRRRGRAARGRRRPLRRLRGAVARGLRTTAPPPTRGRRTRGLGQLSQSRAAEPVRRDLLPDPAVDALAQQVGVPAVARVLLDPVHEQLPNRDRRPSPARLPRSGSGHVASVAACSRARSAYAASPRPVRPTAPSKSPSPSPYSYTAAEGSPSPDPVVSSPAPPRRDGGRGRAATSSTAEPTGGPVARRPGPRTSSAGSGGSPPGSPVASPTRRRAGSVVVAGVVVRVGPHVGVDGRPGPARGLRRGHGHDPRRPGRSTSTRHPPRRRGAAAPTQSIDVRSPRVRPDLERRHEGSRDRRRPVSWAATSRASSSARATRSSASTC